jgi:CubicO group peptidase (beta-lactamase class C family)
MLRLLSFVLTLVVVAADAGDGRTCPNRQSIEQSLIKVHCPGAAIIVVNATDILYEQVIGNQSLSPARPMDVEKSIFALASISKPFIAVAVMQLVELNRVNLDTDINQYLREPVRRISHPLYPSHLITLRQLLSHTASIGAKAGGVFDVLPDDTALTQTTLADMCFTYLSHNASNWLPKPPGNVTLYSNEGAALAALVVERVTQMSYEEYVKERIIKPLGIDANKTGFRLANFENREELVKHYLYAFNSSFLELWKQAMPRLNVTQIPVNT